MRFRNIVLGLLALISIAIGTSAPAQDMSRTPAPPDRFWVDYNGVDLLSGGFDFSRTDVSIGTEESGLEYVRFSAGKGWRDNYTTSIVSSGGVTTVSTGSYSEAFISQFDPGTGGFVYVSVSKKGGRLSYSLNQGTGVGTYTFTAKDGTVATFLSSFRDSVQASLARASEIIYPNGEQLTFYYKLATYGTGPQRASRLQSAVSSLGWQLKLSYARNDSANLSDATNRANWYRVTQVVAFNNTVESCDPSADSCSFVNSWPIATYNETVTVGTKTLTVTDALGRQWVYTTITNFNRLTAIRYPGAAANTIQIGWQGGAVGRVGHVTRGGQTWSYAWALNDDDWLMTRFNPLGQTMTAIAETFITDELGRVTTVNWDASLVNRVTYPEGNYVNWTYDARGNVTERRQVAKSGSGLADIVSTASYDATCTNPKTCNQPNSAIDPRGNQTDFTYDATHGGVLTVTRPAPTVGAVRPQTRYSYSQVGGIWMLTGSSECQSQTSCAGTTDEVKSSITYSGPNSLATSSSIGDGTGALTAVVGMAFDNIGNQLTEDGPLPGTADTTRYRYDAARQRVGIVGPDPDGAGPLKHRATRNVFAPHGPLAKMESGSVNSQSDVDWAAFVPVEAVETTYDTHFRPVTIKLLSGSTTYALTQTSYDTLSRPDCMATRMNPAIYASLPASACTLGTQGSYGPDRIGKTIYDAASQIAQQQVAVGTGDAANEQTLTYTNNGRLATLTDAEVNKTTYEYDGHDRLLKTRMPDTTKGSGTSSTTDYEQLTYDAASNVTNRRQRDSQNIAFTYDNLNRPTLKNVPGSEPDVTNGYDNLGRLTSATQTGNSLSFSYDALSRNLTQMGPQGTVSSQWDVAGRRTRLTYPGAGLFIDYDYLVTGEMTKLRENGAASGIGVLATLAYDDLGRRNTTTFGNGVVQAYAHDPVSRLASLTNNLSGTTNDLSVTFAYNPASQLASTVRTGDAYAWTGHFNQNATGTANGLNQLTSVGAKSLTHDARGNVTAFGTKNFTYSSENLLLTGPNSTTLSYDPQLRLQQVASGATTLRLAYDDLDRIAEYDGANALQRRYVHGPNVDEPLVWYEGPGTTDRRFLSSDERGSIISVTDSAGTLLGLNKYDEYGMPQAGNLGVFGYTGQAWLPTVGLWYYKARVYEPELGRFLQTDPIGYDGGLNLYAYVGNDPINLADALGLGPNVGEDEAKDQGGTNEPPVIVVTGTRCGGYWVGDFCVSGWAREVASFVPLTGLYECYQLGCSRNELLLAGFSETPLGKGFKLGRGAWRLMRKGCGCLEAGTLVATPDGLVPIEQIKVGDMVLAVNEETGEIAAKSVTDLIRPDPKPLYELALRDAGGEAEIFHATDDHPWKVEGKGWVETIDLMPDDRIDTGSGADMLVTSLAITTRVERTYNLTVADWHTFMVGEDGAVVHNACPTGKQIKGTPRTNQAQNRMFADATKGLTKEQKRIVHDEITGRNMTFREIKEIADAVRAGKW